VSAAFEHGLARKQAAQIPLLAEHDFSRLLVQRGTQPITAGRFLADVVALAKRLPSASYAVNLCQDRYRFLVSFCAVVVAGQTNLLPSSRASQAIDEVLQSYASSYSLGDTVSGPRPARWFELPELVATNETVSMPLIAADHIVAIAFTSGSTGVPKANPKTWGSVCASSALNAERLCPNNCSPGIVATVPAQHMYGLELSILLPLRSRATMHAGHPFFPADVAHALEEISAPRLLVTTPFHLRTLLAERIALPLLDGIITATAPLDRELALDAEKRFGTQVIELFGSTETCVIAHRRTSQDEAWQPYRGVMLHPQPDGTLVEAPHFETPTPLQDIVEILPSQQFILRGRNSDLLEIAGKRASLGDLTRRLLAVRGVDDGVVFQLDPDANGMRRLAALVVAPGLSKEEILAALRCVVDPVFLPRRLCSVTALPRNGAGKLPREALLAAIESA
jgi:acyl-coenzyme A synthetase/AMP-(fatty) acid ligase